jgi:hypothetical protein
MEIGVLPGGCLPASELGDGIPPTGTVARVAFAKGNTSPPAIGTLKKASYGFAAVARASDCSVLATGCSIVDVTNARDVSITLAATSAPAGACATSESCFEGQCVPTTNADNPGLGAGCSMQLVGAGPLGLPLQVTGSDTASAPAIAVTESGFLIAYREYDSVAGQARLTIAAVDQGGAMTIPTPTTLPGQCPSQAEADAVGAAYLGGSGVVVSARPACSATPGVDVFQVGATGAITGQAFTPSSTGLPVLSNHAAALDGASSGWLAYINDGTPDLATLNGTTVSTTPSPFGGAAPQTLAAVTATDQTVSLLSGNGSSLAVQIGAAGDAGAPFALQGSWGALAAQGGRTFVLSNGGTGATPLAYAAFDVGGSALSAAGSFTPPGQGAAGGGDVAMSNDFVFFATERTDSVSVVVFGNASTSPTFRSNVLFSDDARIPSQVGVADGLVAMAASSSRVLVTWITQTNLGPNDPVGGYALFACSP